jgi:ferrous iron transport protein B
MEMGLLPGTQVQLVRRSAFGDPLEIRLRDYSLSIRTAEAEAIEVLELSENFPQTTASPLPEAQPLYPYRKEKASCGDEPPRVLIAGNPNAGKTTVFNALTGATARVGNYPGVTVERRSGSHQLPSGERAEIVDLPGTYSLNARSPEEQVAVNSLLGTHGRRPDAVVSIVDTGTLDRNLYLTLQILEMGLPVVLVLNMMDEARTAGIEIDVPRMEELLGVEIVPMVASTGEGMKHLGAAIERAVCRPPSDARVYLGLPEQARQDLAHIENVLRELEFGDTPAIRSSMARWAMLSLGEDELRGVPERLRSEVAKLREETLAQGRDLDREIIEARYHTIEAATHEVRSQPNSRNVTWTEWIDSRLTHPFLGSLAFALVMGGIFQALFSWCDPMIGFVEQGIATSQSLIQASLPSGILTHLLTEGVVAGVGNVLVFAPQIALLFLIVGFLEDCGYLSRVAFLMDRLMGGVGLHGKAFVPMLSGFACAVPAVMSTRTIESRRDRLLTMITLPLMSCSARLPVYVLLTAVIFPQKDPYFGFLNVGAVVLSGMYALSVAATLTAAAVLRRTILRGPRPPLVLELPPYRLPVLRNLLTGTWFRVRKFLVDAGSIILAMTILLWGLLTFPGDAARDARFQAQRSAITQNRNASTRTQALQEINDREAQEKLEQSYAGRLGKLMEPALRPLGFDWRVSIGILGAFSAREVFVSTMGVVFGIQGADEGNKPLRTALRQATWPDGRPLFTPLMGISLMVFFVLACQCMSTLATIQRESGSWIWPMLTVCYMSAMAYGASLMVYQGGTWLGF